MKTIQEQKKKKFNKKLLLTIVIGVFALTIIAAYGYQMLSVRSHINVGEGQTIQYLENDVWKDFPINTRVTLDLGQSTINAGDYSDFNVQGINGNKRAIEYTMTIDKWDGITSSFVCSQVGVMYALSNDETGNLVVKINNPPSSTSAGIVRTTLDAGLSLTSTYPINPITTLTRGEVEEGIEWQTCPSP